MRHRYQGVWNIVRFNWHFYVIAGITIFIAWCLRRFLSTPARNVLDLVVILTLCSIFVSLLVSWYIYDVSDLYKLSWLNNLLQRENKRIVNIHAGFDETSGLLASKFKSAELVVFDFYDPSKHTEVSIKRARKAYAPFPATQQISTGDLPLSNGSADMIFVMLSAHEIRSEEERIDFFKEIKRVLVSTGQVVVTEHQRDVPNFLAYNVGFFHFYSRATWLKTFAASGLNVTNQIKTTPFVTTFVLEKNGTTH